MDNLPGNQPQNPLRLCALGCALNSLLLFLPFAVTGSLTISPSVIVFAVLINAWVIAEGLAAGAITCNQPQHRAHAWLPGAMGLSLLLLLWVSLFDFFQGTRLTQHSLACALLGGLLITSGIVLRLVAIKTLNKFFLSHVALAEDHELVTSGIYNLMRHPSETGFLAICLGFPLLLSSPNGLLLTIPLLCLVLLRIRWEDDLLSSTFGNDFQSYKARTNVLLPRVTLRSLSSAGGRQTRNAI